MGDIDDLLEKDSLNGLFSSLEEDRDNIDILIVVYTRKDGSLTWGSNCKRSEGLGLCDVVHHDLLTMSDVDYEGE